MTAKGFLQVQARERRRFLGHALAGISAAACPFVLNPVVAQGARGVSALRDSVSLINAGGSNVVVCETGEGLVLVDSGMPAFSSDLMSILQGMNKEIHTLFNTHWHAEQCGANAELGAAGAHIIAHQKTRHHLSVDYYLPPEERYHRALPEAAWPVETFWDSGSLNPGNETIDYGALVQPHTDADIYVYFREANVLAAGGAVAGDADPELDWYGGGWLGGRADSLDTLVALSDADTMIVPAHGNIMTYEQLVAERDMTHTLYQRLNDLIRSGCSARCMEEKGALEGLGRQWQDPQQFLYSAYKGLWAHHYNLAPDIL